MKIKTTELIVSIFLIFINSGIKPVIITPTKLNGNKNNNGNNSPPVILNLAENFWISIPLYGPTQGRKYPRRASKAKITCVFLSNWPIHKSSKFPNSFFRDMPHLIQITWLWFVAMPHPWQKFFSKRWSAPHFKQAIELLFTSLPQFLQYIINKATCLNLYDKDK